MGKLLSILIPTIVGREAQYNQLYNALMKQVEPYNKQVEIICNKDNREITIGAKRQRLLEAATGKFVVFIDDDDEVSEHYLDYIVTTIISDETIDCIGFLQACTFNTGETRLASLSNRWDDWLKDTGGYAFVRTPFFPNPILRQYALEIGYRDMKFGEDHDFSRRLKQAGLIRNEYFINEVLYYYQFTYVPNKYK